MNSNRNLDPRTVMMIYSHQLGVPIAALTYAVVQEMRNRGVSPQRAAAVLRAVLGAGNGLVNFASARVQNAMARLSAAAYAAIPYIATMLASNIGQRVYSAIRNAAAIRARSRGMY